MRHRRLLLYVALLILALGLLGFWNWERLDLKTQTDAATARMLASSKSDVERFLANQTNAPKLVSLAKRLTSIQPSLVQPVIEKAYQLAPTNPDAVFLASAYHPDLKTKALQLNPLADQAINPAAPLGQLR